MALSTRILNILNMPQVSTSYAREVAWAVDYWKREYAKVTAQSKTAWEQYNEAIDKELPRAEINEYYFIAKLFDELKRDTWHQLDDAKARYLALQN